MTRLAFESGTVAEVAELFAGGPQANLEAMAGFFAERQSVGELRDDLPPTVLAEGFFSLAGHAHLVRAGAGPGTRGAAGAGDGRARVAPPPDRAPAVQGA